MSDDKRNDPWTQGEESPPSGGREPLPSSAETEPGREDAETLQARERLAQVEMLDRWVGGVLAEQRRSRRWKLFFRFVFVVLILGLLSATLYGLLFAGAMTGEPERPHLGVVELRGAIDAEAPASAERLIAGLNRAWESPGAEAVVLHIDSPGGSPVQSQRVFDEIMRLREQGDKPIIAVIEDVGASGAYYIAAAADEIVASPASLVGSIGVIFSGFGFEEAIDRLGVERRVYTAGEDKAFLDPFSEVAPDQRRFWQSVLDTTHQQFIDAVREGRGDRLADDDELFSGLIWSGEQALSLGLIDGLDSIEGVARSRLGEVRLHNYTPKLDPFERLGRRFGQVAMEWLGVPESSSPVRYQLAP